jgi:hypothetical protein
MTKKEIEQKYAELLKQMEEREKPSTLQAFLSKIKPYIIPVIIGVIIGNFGLPKMPVAFPTLTTIQQQAVQGGTAIPFPSVFPSPSHSNSPPGNSTKEWNDLSWMSTSEPPSACNPQADSGQTTSTKSSRPPIR